MAKAPDQIISGSGGVVAGLPTLAIKTAKAGLFVGLGFVAAEVGAASLRTTIGQIETFASKGTAQSAGVRAGIGTVITLATAFILARPRAGQSSAMRKARMTAAARVALLMEIGVAASAAREYVAEGVTMITAKVQSVLPHKTATAGGTFTPNYAAPRMLRAGGTLSAPGGTVGRFGGAGQDSVRAGGDAGFQRPSFIDPTRITQTEVGM